MKENTAHGLTREVLDKIASKYDSETERQCMEWVQSVIGETIYSENETGMDATFETLKDGKILCKLMNALKPGAIKKINTLSSPFKQMENIEHFLRAATEYGLSPSELFQTVDLYKQQNMVQVLITIMALGRKSQANGFKGPSLGPKEATKHQRDFTEEQMKQGDTIIGLQMGSNKGANQSGINFGKTRSILD